MTGDPIRVDHQPGLSDRHGPVHAGTFVRERRIAFNCPRREFPRILVHELFHFAWVRLGNSRRYSYENLLRAEIASGARGELGWSAEWRKAGLSPADPRTRTRRWREYCCESFCDSAAWLYSGIHAHDEFTLPRRLQHLRQDWFARTLASGPLSI